MFPDPTGPPVAFRASLGIRVCVAVALDGDSQKHKTQIQSDLQALFQHMYDPQNPHRLLAGSCNVATWPDGSSSLQSGAHLTTCTSLTLHQNFESGPLDQSHHCIVPALQTFLARLRTLGLGQYQLVSDPSMPAGTRVAA